MEIGHFRSMDQKNRVRVPVEFMKLLGVAENSEVYVSVVMGEDFIRIYPKKTIDKKIKESYGRRS